MSFSALPPLPGLAFRWFEGTDATPVVPGRPTLIWLHGWARTHADWRRLISDFPGWRHLAVDAPGFGAAPPPPAPWGPQEYAVALLADLDQVAPGPVVLVGHSFGCRVSLCAATLAPERVLALALVAAPGIPRPRSLTWHVRAKALRLLGTTAKLADRLFRAGLHARYASRFGSPDYKAAGALRPTFVKVISTDLSDVARSVTCPVSFVYGARDTETPPELGPLFQRLIPHAQVHVVPGAGHLDILSGFAVATSERIRQALSALPDTGRGRGQDAAHDG
jgi:pimeloyl-ACP methyl ester carboxylesterase